MKYCPGCEVTKPRNDFYNSKIRKDGKASWCKACMKAHTEKVKTQPKIVVDEKTCSKCRETKPADKFSGDIGRRDGYRSTCKKCHRELMKVYNGKNKEKINERNRVYFESAKGKEVAKKWREENKENLKKYLYQWRKNNPEKLKKIDKHYREKNQEKRNKRLKEQALSPVTYNTYHPQLTPDEQTFNADGILGIKCFYCNKEYTPTLREVMSRINGLNNLNQGENHIYCSEGCKQACPTYKKQYYPSEERQSGTSREMQPEFRKKVLERDNWTCQKCASTNVELHAHHIMSHRQEYDSMHESNGITLCQTCHSFIHKQEGCSSQDIAKSCL